MFEDKPMNEDAMHGERMAAKKAMLGELISTMKDMMGKKPDGEVEVTIEKGGELPADEEPVEAGEGPGFDESVVQEAMQDPELKKLIMEKLAAKKAM